MSFNGYLTGGDIPILALAHRAGIPKLFQSVGISGILTQHRGHNHKMVVVGGKANHKTSGSETIHKTDSRFSMVQAGTLYNVMPFKINIVYKYFLAHAQNKYMY